MNMKQDGSGAAPKHQRDVPSIFISVACVAFMMIIFIVGYPGFKTVAPMGGMSNGTSFHLVDDQGAAVTDRSWGDKFLLIYFGYTHCPDICPTTLANIAVALKDLGNKANRVQPLFISVDPQRDTPAVIKQYTALFSPRIVGLTGTPQEVAEAAQNYGVRFARQKAVGDPADYAMAHTDSIYLLYPSGAMALTLPPGQTPGQIVSAIGDRL